MKVLQQHGVVQGQDASLQVQDPSQLSSALSMLQQLSLVSGRQSIDIGAQAAAAVKAQLDHWPHQGADGVGMLEEPVGQLTTAITQQAKELASLRRRRPLSGHELWKCVLPKVRAVFTLIVSRATCQFQSLHVHCRR